MGAALGDFVIMNGYECTVYGEWHDELPLSFGAGAPYWYDVIAPEERETRAKLSFDQCVAFRMAEHIIALLPGHVESQNPCPDPSGRIAPAGS